jgi:hypothetical protein
VCFRCSDGYGYDLFEPGFVLSTSAQMDAAMYNKQPVTIRKEGTILAEGIVIDSHNETTARINGEYYAKDACDFTVSQPVVSRL